MGRKRLSKRYPVFFHLATCLVVMVILSSCQGMDGRLINFNGGPEYAEDFQYLERVRSFVGQEDFKSALAENEKLEKRSELLENGNDDYTRVIMISARMNTTLLEKVIQDEENRLRLSKEIEQRDRTIKKQGTKIDTLVDKVREMNTLFKALGDLELENKTLQQQIKDFKEIDLEGDKIKPDL